MFGTGHVTIRQMARGGIILNVIAVLVITVVTVLLAGPLLGAS